MLGLIIGGLAAAGSMIMSCAGTIGTALASSASSLLGVVGKHLVPVSNIISSLAQILGIFKKEDTPEDLGRRAIVSTQKPEDFDSTEQYIEHLRNDIELDQEKMKKETDVEKMAYTAIGAGIGIKSISEKKGFDIPMETWVTFAKLGMEIKEKEINALLDFFKGDIGKVSEYAEGKLSAKEEMEVGGRLMDHFKEDNPAMPEADIEKKVMDFDTSGKHL